MVTSRIRAAGYYVPEHVVTNEDLTKLVDTSDEWIRTRTGIRERRIAMNEGTTDLAAKAAARILEQAGTDAGEIDLLLVATITGDYAMPSTACMVQERIGAVNAAAFDLTAACSGFIFALCTADKFLRSGGYRRALVIGAEMLSKSVDWLDRSTCVLFGDGAGGVLLERNEDGTDGILAELLGSDGSKGMALTSGLFPAANVFNRKTGCRPTSILMDGREIFKFATKQIPANIEELLAKTGTEKTQIAHVILHQANERIIQAVAGKLQMPEEKFFCNIAQYGNTSSASIPIALAQMLEQGRIKPGEIVILSGFGGGLTWGSVLIRM